MRGVRIHTTGSPDVLVYEEAPVPDLRADEVLVRVHAAGVNPADCRVRLGTERPRDLAFPVVLGRDVSGVVERIGPTHAEFRVGDAVFGVLARHGGAYAELAVAGPGELARKPGALEHVQAAAVPTAALTAWQGLFEHGGLSAGQSVLIHGAGGGVGHFAVQFARLAQARVIATAASEDLDLVSRLGADIVIDFGAMPFQRVVTSVDVVFDLVAGAPQRQSWGVLRQGGMLVSAVGTPEPAADTQPLAVGKGFRMRSDAHQLREIARLIEAGRVSVVVSRVLPLAQARHAHALLEDAHSQGKTVLRVA